MKHTPKTIGELVKNTRKTLRVTQKDLAMTSGTGLRFIIDVEKGKVDPTDALEQEFKAALAADTTTVIVVRTQPQEAML